MTNPQEGSKIALAALLLALGLLLLTGGSVQAAKACKELSKSHCTKSDDCSWISGYTTSKGSKVSAYCRTKPGKSKQSATGSSKKKVTKARSSTASEQAQTSKSKKGAANKSKKEKSSKKKSSGKNTDSGEKDKAKKKSTKKKSDSKKSSDKKKSN